MTVTLRRYTHADAADLRETLLDVHQACYAGDENRGDFDTRERFAWFVDHWSGRPGWTCVIGYDGEQPVGFAYGAPLPPESKWWAKIEGLDEEFAAETGTRTYAVSEVMVRPEWRKTGTAERLHEDLLANRTEERATLLVDASHPRVEALYRAWHYKPVGSTQPFDDAPVMTAMVRTLPPAL